MLNEEHYEYLNNTTLYFAETGNEDAPAVVYLHSLGYNSYSFADLADEYLQQDYHMVYLDQRGCGRSGQLEQDVLLLDDLVEDLEAVRDFLALDAFYPMGHGFGALVALEYSRRYPQHSLGSVLINPWIHMPELALNLLEYACQLTNSECIDPKPELMAEWDGEGYPAIGAARAEKAFSLVPARDLLNQMQFPEAIARLRLEHSDVESQLFASAEVQEALVMGGFWEFEYTPYLLEQTRPVYVLAGEFDHTSYPHQTDWLRHFTQKGKGQLLPAGHYPWADDAEMFADALGQVLLE